MPSAGGKKKRKRKNKSQKIEVELQQAMNDKNLHSIDVHLPFIAELSHLQEALEAVRGGSYQVSLELLESAQALQKSLRNAQEAARSKAILPLLFF